MNDEWKHAEHADTAMIIVSSRTPYSGFSDFQFINSISGVHGSAYTRTWILDELAPFIDKLFYKYYPDGGPPFDIEFVPFILSLLDTYWRSTTFGDLPAKYTILSLEKLTVDKFDFLYAERILSEWNDQ